MNIKALVPGIIQRAQRAGIRMSRWDAEMLAAEMLDFDNWDQRQSFLDERLSELYDKYHLHMFLTKRPDYQVSVTGY